MSDVKRVVLSKQAAADMMGGSLPPKKRNRASRKSQHGETTDHVSTSTPPSGPATVIKLGHVGGDLPPPPPMPSSNTSTHVKTNSSVSTPITNTQTYPVQQAAGEHKVVKVELKKKIATKKVHLQPKKGDAPKATLHGKKTVKKPRRITLGVSSMQRRLTRAKKTQTRVRDMPLDELKKLLITKKLIKPTSTAPESILRQIAADAQIVADKAL